jgi:predicted NBD/HSP70 family sugar kinase
MLRVLNVDGRRRVRFSNYKTKSPPEPNAEMCPTLTPYGPNRRIQRERLRSSSTHVGRGGALQSLKSGIERVDLAEVRPCTNVVSRAINRNILLQLIRTHQPVSRADLARRSGLEPSTVSQIAEQLIHEGWVSAGSMGHLSRGRPPALLTLNEEIVVYAVDVQLNQIVVAMVDLNGNVLTHSSQLLDTDPLASIRSTVSALEELWASSKDKSVVGIGISVPGRVDSRSQQLVFGPRPSGVPVNFKQAIEEQMGLDAEIEHAVNSCLMSELWFGQMDGVRNAVLLNVSEEITVGILANGSLMTGHHGTAGEFGHIAVDPSGPLCECGQRGCWGSVASTKAALRYYKRLAPKTGGITFLDLLNLASEGDKNASKAIDMQATKLGEGLRMISYALSPEVVLVLGEVTARWDRFLPILERAVSIPPIPGAPPRLQPIRGCHIARLRGAAATLLQRRSQASVDCT